MIRATERALPCPLAAPMSARRQPGVLAASASDGRPGQRLDGRAVRAERVQVERQRRRRDHVRDPAPVAFGGADLEVGAQRPGDLLGDELLERLAGDPAHDLADQVPEVERVVARRGARLPPRRLGRQPGGGLVPVVEVLHDGGLVQPGHPGGVRHAGAGPARPACRWRRTPASTRATGASTSSSPRSTSISAARLVTVLVVDQTLVMVCSATGPSGPRRRSRPTGRRRSRRRGPPRSTRRVPRLSPGSAPARCAPPRTAPHMCHVRLPQPFPPH